MLDSGEVCRLIPALRPEYVAGGVFEPEASDIDIHALHRGFLQRRAAPAQCGGGRACANGPEAAGGWRSADGGTKVEARIVRERRRRLGRRDRGELAGAIPIGLVPKRRTAFTFEAETGAWPMAVDVDEQFYFKPESGRVLGSLADEDAFAALRCAAGGDRCRDGGGPDRARDDSSPSAASSGAGRACAASSPTRRWWRVSMPMSPASSGVRGKAATASRPRRLWG